MELTTFADLKNIDVEKELSNDIELNKMNQSMNDLSGQLEEYLKNNELDNQKEDILKRPIDVDITTEKNEFGDTTILGKITIEKSVAKDLEKIQSKVENTKDKSVSMIKNGLMKVYDVLKDTFVGKVAEKVLDVGGNILKKGKVAIINAAKVLGKRIVR